MKYLFILLAFIVATYNCKGQQYPDRHSTSATDAWLSCTTSSNPNPLRTDSHWIMYDLAASYTLGEMVLWNYNDPSHLDYGVDMISVDLSIDGLNWTEYDVVNVPQSLGSTFYEGVSVLDFNQIEANYILITSLSNHGGTCTGFSEMKVNLSSVLPIELSMFNVKCSQEEGGVNLDWRTATEINNDYFTVERSIDAFNWEGIAHIAAKGMDGKGSIYQFLDNKVGGTLYYRLVNTDIDGQSQYSNVKVVQCTDEEISGITASNPFTHLLQFTYKSESTTTYSLTSSSGQIMYIGNSSSTEPNIEINTTGWSSGIYFLKINSETNSYSIKLVKI